VGDVTSWLLDGPPWVVYRTRIDLLSESEEEAQVAAARQAMLDHPQVRQLIDELAEWPGPALKSHKTAWHPLHKLAFVADLGLHSDDPGMECVVERVLAHRSPEGPFQVVVNVPTRFGGTGEDTRTWMLCDASLVVYALAAMGLEQDPMVVKAVEYLVGLVRETGWPCAAAPEWGKFRGPGSASDPCPYTNLIMLRALAALPDWHDHDAARAGAEALLTLWEQRRERKAFLFGMGTDFAKLKAPLIWYDVVHVLDVLTRFHWLHDDPRLQEMVAIVEGKADAEGRFTPESVWRAWKDWDFGQKREPSRWLTLVVSRMLGRLR
jgi:hypothetical protein